MEFVHKGENKMRFNPTKETKQVDIEWFHELFKRRVDITIEQVFKVETSRLMSSLAGNQQTPFGGFFSKKDANMCEIRTRLEGGDSFFGDEAAEMGLVDAAITPDEFFSEMLFKD